MLPYRLVSSCQCSPLHCAALEWRDTSWSDCVGRSLRCPMCALASLSSSPTTPHTILDSSTLHCTALDHTTPQCSVYPTPPSALPPQTYLPLSLARASCVFTNYTGIPFHCAPPEENGEHFWWSYFPFPKVYSIQQRIFSD